MEKQLDLFGEEVIETNVNRKSRQEVIEDYEAFLDKHDKKKNDRRLLYTAGSVRSR